MTVPNSVTSIDFRVLDSCTALKSVTLGNSVSRIDEGVFANCSSLTNIAVSPDNPAYIVQQPEKRDDWQ